MTASTLFRPPYFPDDQKNRKRNERKKKTKQKKAGLMVRTREKKSSSFSSSLTNNQICWKNVLCYNARRAWPSKTTHTHTHRDHKSTRDYTGVNPLINRQFPGRVFFFVFFFAFEIYFIFSLEKDDYLDLYLFPWKIDCFPFYGLWNLLEFVWCKKREFGFWGFVAPKCYSLLPRRHSTLFDVECYVGKKKIDRDDVLKKK